MSLTFNEWIEVDGCGAMPLNLLTKMEQLTCIVQDVLTNLTADPVGGLFQLDVNGQIFTPVDGSFIVAGRVIIWGSTIYSINPGDTVVAIYSYMG